MLRSRPQSYFLAHWIEGGGLLFSLVLIGAPKRRRSRASFLLLMLLMIIAVPACGGGSSSHAVPPPVPNLGTPLGTYNVVVTATSSAITSITGFTLFVQ